MTETNPYCTALGISPPRLEAVKEHREGNYYRFFIVALLERGGPMTLAEAAQRFEEAGVASADRALASLKRCKPGRPPIYRDGDLYALDPHDDNASLWAFRLGLRSPRAPALRVVRPNPGLLPSQETPLSLAHLEEAWRGGIPGGWSAQRVAICVLDAHGMAMESEAVLAFTRARGGWCRLSAGSAGYWRSGSPILLSQDGLWVLDARHSAVSSARRAVIDRIEMMRRWQRLQPDAAVIQANQNRFERDREAQAARLAGMRRVIVHAFPAGKPEAVVLLDVERRETTTLLGEEVAGAGEKLLEYDIIAAVDVRALLRHLDFDPGERRLGELGPPQKTMQINRQGRKLRITLDLLIRSSCGISRPLGDAKTLRGYLHRREFIKLKRRLEADAKSLFALYQYGRLHGVVRLCWGHHDERIAAPWVHRVEPTLYELMRRAHDLDQPLDIVVGSAPRWSDPWARVQQAYVDMYDGGWQKWLVDAQGCVIDDQDVQLARLWKQETPEI